MFTRKRKKEGFQKGIWFFINMLLIEKQTVRILAQYMLALCSTL